MLHDCACLKVTGGVAHFTGKVMHAREIQRIGGIVLNQRLCEITHRLLSTLQTHHLEQGTDDKQNRSMYSDIEVSHLFIDHQ